MNKLSIACASWALVCASSIALADPVSPDDFILLPAGVFPTAVSSNGIVAGFSGSSIFRYTPTEGLVNLGRPFFSNGNSVGGINSSGVIVGQTANGTSQGAYSYDPETGYSIILNVNGASANAIANSGQVTGSDGSRAFRFTPGQGVALLGSRTQLGSAINELGQVAGFGDPFQNGSNKAFFTTLQGTVEYLSAPNAFVSYGRGINNQGQVLVQSLARTLSSNGAFIYTPGQGYAALPETLTNGHDVVGINNNGWVVGTLNSAGTLWKPGEATPIDLADYVLRNFGSSFIFDGLRGINDNGTMVGFGRESLSSPTRGFILTIPSPAGATLLFALGVVGSRRLRRISHV